MLDRDKVKNTEGRPWHEGHGKEDGKQDNHGSCSVISMLEENQ